MGRFSAAMTRFFAGRYGLDTLGKWQLGLYFVLVLVNAFVHTPVLLVPELLLFIWCMMRVLSRNVGARVRENDWFLSHTDRLRRWGRLQRNRWRDRRTHVYRTCPHCRAVIRLPKTRRGRHTCDCPRCRREFSVRI